MTNKRLNSITQEIDLLIQDLLIPLRTSKTINRNAFDKLYTLLDETGNIIKDEDVVPVQLVGKLLFIYITMNGEGDHVKYTDPIFMEIGKVESYLSKIFRSK